MIYVGSNIIQGIFRIYLIKYSMHGILLSNRLKCFIRFSEFSVTLSEDQKLDIIAANQISTTSDYKAMKTVELFS